MKLILGVIGGLLLLLSLGFLFICPLLGVLGFLVWVVFYIIVKNSLGR
jgi:hypothetical protein